jgi:hypothetical protein
MMVKIDATEAASGADDRDIKGDRGKRRRRTVASRHLAESLGRGVGSCEDRIVVA